MRLFGLLVPWHLATKSGARYEPGFIPGLIILIDRMTRAISSVNGWRLVDSAAQLGA